MFGDIVFNEKQWNTHKLIDICKFNSSEVGLAEEKMWLLNLDMIESQTGRVIDYLEVDNNNIPSSTVKFNENCVLYSKLRPYLNKVVIPNKSGYGTSELIAIETNSKINKYYLASALRSDSFVKFIDATSYGVKMPRASVDALKNFCIPVPPINKQNDFEFLYKQCDKLKFIYHWRYFL